MLRDTWLMMNKALWWGMGIVLFCSSITLAQNRRFERIDKNQEGRVEKTVFSVSGSTFKEIDEKESKGKLKVDTSGGGDTITVNVTDTYSPKFLSFIGIGNLTVTSHASARLIRSLGGSEQ